MSKVTITISKEAADCLAWWNEHPMYGPDFSETIITLMTEWLNRENKSWKDAMIEGSYISPKKKK